MILTICFDPILEKKYYVEALQPKIENCASKKVYNLSGKGISTGRLLNKLNIDVFAIGFLGGLQGQYIFNTLKEANIYNEFIFIKDETRSRVSVIQDRELLTMITEPSPRITREEINSFYELYGRLLDRFNIICGLGNLPTGLSSDMYFDLIDMANRNNKKFIFESEGRELKYGLEAKPFMVKLRKKDLEYLSNLELDFENEIIKVGHSIVESGVEIVCIDLDDKGSIILTKDRGYRLEIGNSNINDIGEDNGYMVGGFAFGIYKNYDLETTMRLSQAARLVYSRKDDQDLVDMSDIKRMMSQIDIYSINY